MGTGELNIFLIILTFVVATGIIATYQLIFKLVIPSVKNRKFKQFISTWAFRSQLLAWCLFIMFFFYQYFNSAPYFTIASVTIVLILGWIFWRDLIAGLIFKIDNKVSIGDTIECCEHTGKVNFIGNRNIILESSNKEQVILYHRMIVSRGYKIIREQDIDNAIEFKVAKSTLLKFGGVKEVQKLIEASPWASTLNQPEILISDNDHYLIKIWALNPDDKEKYKNSILFELNIPI